MTTSAVCQEWFVNFVKRTNNLLCIYPRVVHIRYFKVLNHAGMNPCFFHCRRRALRVQRGRSVGRSVGRTVERKAGGRSSGRQADGKRRARYADGGRLDVGAEWCGVGGRTASRVLGLQAALSRPSRARVRGGRRWGEVCGRRAGCAAGIASVLMVPPSPSLFSGAQGAKGAGAFYAIWRNLRLDFCLNYAIMSMEIRDVKLSRFASLFFVTRSRSDRPNAVSGPFAEYIIIRYTRHGSLWIFYCLQFFCISPSTTRNIALRAMRDKACFCKQ